MLEGSDTALAGEEKQVNFKLNMIFYWTGAALSLSLLVGAIGWSYQLIVRDINQIPIVRAQLGPLRVAPDDPGGLTAAMLLAKRGFKVTLFEKENKVGGRNSSLVKNGYKFDVGPTFLMMKFINAKIPAVQNWHVSIII